MRQVEFKATTKIGFVSYEPGDRKSFDDDEAAEYIRLGWAKCVETGEDNDPVPGAQKLRVHPITQPNSA